MYYYWKSKGIRPSVFYSMPRGELTVLQAFYEKEVQEKNELIKKSEGKAVCPLWFMM
jgi:hypothetical protein